MSVELILIQALRQTLNELESTEQKRKVFSMNTVNTIRFTVGDTTAYGIYNGFDEYDEVFRDIVKKTIPNEIDKWDRYDIADQITRHLNDWRNQCVIAEAKEYQIDAKTCQVPVPVAERMVQDAAAEVMRKLSEKKIAYYTQTLDHIEAVTFKTAEEAERAAVQYNNINNDGGYGYVPRFYTEAEVVQMKQQLAVWKKYAASV